MWRDAYGAISRASTLEIVGYSMPPDDIEIRTLLRAGVQRGDNLDEVVVRNPAPEVHVRVRQYLDRRVRSDYRSCSGFRDPRKLSAARRIFGAPSPVIG